MQRAAPAKCNQREVSRIVATLDRNNANGLLHRGLDDAQNPRGKLFDRTETSLRLVHILHHPFAVELDGTSQEAVRIEPPKRKIGIGDGRLSAAPEADRPGIGARRFRADAQQPASIEARDRASAGAGSMDVEHRNADRDARHHGLVADPRTTGIHQSKRQWKFRPCRSR